LSLYAVESRTAIGQGRNDVTLSNEDVVSLHRERARRHVTAASEVCDYILDSLVATRDCVAAWDGPDHITGEYRVQPLRRTASVKLLLGGVQQTDALTNAVESVVIALAHPRVLFTREIF
jgi:hypothetical protein